MAVRLVHLSSALPFLQLAACHRPGLQSPLTQKTDINALQSYSEASSSSTTLSLESWAGWFHTVNISLGTPPQNFRTVVDIGWTDLLVPSTGCMRDYGYCNDASNLYDPTESATNVNEHIPLSENHNDCAWVGLQNQDTVTIGDLRLQHMSFLNGIDVQERDSFVPNHAWDAVLGLPRLDHAERTPTPPYSSINSKGPLHTLIEEGLLELDVFTLNFPASGRFYDQSGQLTLGRIDHEAYVGELMTLPMSKIAKELEYKLPSSWHVELHEISFGDHTYPMPNHHGLLTTMMPFVGLPMGMWNILMRELNAQPSIYPYVECSKRSEMPEIFFRLGPDQTTVGISPWDYIIEVEWPLGNTWCYAPFWGYNEYEFPIPNSIYLSTGFLRGFYSVFDVDNGTLSLGYKPRSFSSA